MKSKCSVDYSEKIKQKLIKRYMHNIPKSKICNLLLTAPLVLGTSSCSITAVTKIIIIIRNVLFRRTTSILTPFHILVYACL